MLQSGLLGGLLGTAFCGFGLYGLGAIAAILELFVEVIVGGLVQAGSLVELGFGILTPSQCPVEPS
jgi:hypothetical protein